LVRTGFGFACRHWHSFAKPAAAEHATSSRVDTLSPRYCFAPFRASQVICVQDFARRKSLSKNCGEKLYHQTSQTRRNK
jgi:hypothetical protein